MPKDEKGHGSDPKSVGELESHIKSRVAVEKLALSHRKDGSIELSNIQVRPEKRGQGRGHEAMNHLTGYADKHGHRIVLNTASRDDGWGTTSKKRLGDFYKSHGFVENKGKHKDYAISHEMYREPKR